jgi:hypothetical protein
MATLSHDQLLVNVAQSMRGHGMTAIRVDHLAGYAQPDEIGRYRPDATGYYRGSLRIVEAESRDRLSLAHTVEQLTMFLAAARRANGALVVAVNAADAPDARALLRRIGATDQDTLVWTY